MISVHFQGKPFNTTVIQVYAPTSNAEEAEVPENSKEREESLPQRSVQRNRGKQQNGKSQRSLQENERYQGNISCQDGHNKGQKRYAPNISRRY